MAVFWVFFCRGCPAVNLDTGMYTALGGDLSIGYISYCECNGERYGKIEKDIDLWR